MNTAASEQTEPEELKENGGGRDRWAGVEGRQRPLVASTPARGGSEAFAWVQRPEQAWLTDWRVPVSPSPPQDLQPRDGSRAHRELFLKVPLPLGGPGPQGSEGWAQCPCPYHGDLEGTEVPPVTWGPQTQGPRASRCSLPPSLYLKTWGRQSSGEAGGGEGGGGNNKTVHFF